MAVKRYRGLSSGSWAGWIHKGPNQAEDLKSLLNWTLGKKRLGGHGRFNDLLTAFKLEVKRCNAWVEIDGERLRCGRPLDKQGFCKAIHYRIRETNERVTISKPTEAEIKPYEQLRDDGKATIEEVDVE